MWRRTYLLLILVRLYFALSPSYLHPDENFQGPEVIAGQIFSYPVHLTWEFTSSTPIRSVFPLWPVYGLPMLLLHWTWSGHGPENHVTPAAVYWTLRSLMFLLSFVLEDWAIHELVPSPRHRRIAVLLVASSYVTWTYQTHTFSNSIETLLVAWSLVLIQRILDDKQRSSMFASGILGFLVVVGVFNRITFPAFLFIPALRLVPHVVRKPFSLLALLLVGIFTTILAVYLDTRFYTPVDVPVTLSTLLHRPVFTPLNSILYNSSPSNLADHGLHPFYQHFIANLSQLLGPAYILLLTLPRFNLRLVSAISGIVVLSAFQHQEARFLIPTIPLILSSIRLPTSPRWTRLWITAWILFNALFGILMGVYHQGGVVPMQLHLASQEHVRGQALWWRTYSPPVWLLDGKNEELATRDLMGLHPDLLIEQVAQLAPCQSSTAKNATYLIAPHSSTFLDPFTQGEGERHGRKLHFEKIWHYRNHFNLDDLDIGEEGVWPTLKRVVGRRGLDAWKVTRECAYR
ncbi:MAG: alpha 1,2 mannosyltransferase [Caeruleum heppii]|nr:MAG: alpha 1,2 mannosyltransferase [Caeruleum heppii]